jgi:hypothetical protein
MTFLRVAKSRLPPRCPEGKTSPTGGRRQLLGPPPHDVLGRGDDVCDGVTAAERGDDVGERLEFLEHRPARSRCAPEGFRPRFEQHLRRQLRQVRAELGKRSDT